MMLNAAVVSVVFLAFSLVSVARSGMNPGGVVKIRFERFSNLKAQKYLQGSGRLACCDGTFFCMSACDPYFQLCLKMTQGARRCASTFRTKTFRNKKIIVFARNEVLKTRPRLFRRSVITHRNPVMFKFSRWQGFFNLAIVIKDQDFPSRDDLMDTFLIKKSLLPSPGDGNAHWCSFSARGKTSQLKISYSVQCNKGLYGPECTTKCQPRNGPEGHFSCDRYTGQKQCLPGWFGPSCLAPCAPRHDDVRGHYTCDVTGRKICHRRWFGTNCTVFCKETPGSRCDKNGNRFCLQNWFGKICNKRCVPSGNFVCDLVTGEKKCASGWFGKQCDAHCLETGGETATFNCSSNGQKICHKDWYGKDCDKFCATLRNSVCDNATGDRICDKGWHGVNCDSYCVPKNNQNAAYLCDTFGDKICYTHWYGDKCDVFCLPSFDGRYECNRTTGVKDCTQGWSGADCDKKVCAPRNDRNAGFTCDRKGNRVCLKNWYPEGRCNVFCQPQHFAYQCNQMTGEKICRAGWYPPNRCNVYCLPRDDLSSAYRCDPLTGQKSCMLGWYGPNCDCAPTNDKTAGYNCNKTTGARVCLPGWTGPMCDVPDV